ncbi:MAG: diacylglycerol kinase [Betaproteobacteria bacterium]|nr:diacylglycerol kinase [Betaproteobacteria bacterium]
MTSPHKGKSTGVRRLVAAARYSLQGFAAALRHEEAFRMEVGLAMVLVPAGIWIGASGTAKALLAGSVLLVLVIELLNSALESAVDRISPDDHPLSGRAKDIGSAAVVLSIGGAVLTWTLVLLG